MQQVQLEWDGVVLPVPETSWASVLATAERFQGLDLNTDFFVTYKDEEADVINVRSEVDFAEALQWALEQKVPCLCLHVPFSSDESDTDESWTEVETGAQRESEHATAPSYAEDLEQQPIVQTRYEEVVDEEEEESLAQTVEEESESYAPLNTVTEQLTSTEPVSVISTVREEAAPVLKQISEVQTVTPILDVLEEVSNEIAKLNLSEEASLKSPPSGLTLERLIELLCSLNGDETGLDREYVLGVLGDKDTLDAVSNLVAHPAVAEAIRAVVQAEKANPGTLHKAATTQLIKTISLNTDTLRLLNSIPGASELVVRCMHSLRTPTVRDGTPTSNVSATVHQNVECDGCSSDPALANASSRDGFRNADGVIVGTRYKSVTLPDYDLCEACESSGRFDGQAGPFLKLRSSGQAPELIFCVMPGATNGVLSQLESMDWRNPLVREFSQFVQSRQTRPGASSNVSAPVASTRPPAPQPPPRAVDVSAAQQTSNASPSDNTQATQVQVNQSDLRCRHVLQRFNAANKNYRCDMCNRAQALHSTLFGCRECNFDLCGACYGKRFGITVPSVVTPEVVAASNESAAPLPVVDTRSMPQAKFVADVTLADGCTVRAGERLVKTWRVRNTGSERWVEGTRIAHVGGDAFGAPMEGVLVPLANAGAIVDVSVSVTMPQQPGRYTSYWRLMTPHPQNSKFGHRFWITCNVLPAEPTPAPVFVRAVPPPPPTVVTQLVGSPAPLARPPVAPPVTPSAPPAFQELSTVEDVPAEYVETVSRIMDLGFTDINAILAALRATNGEATDAIERLLEQS